MTAIRNITEEYLTDQWRIALEKFITHYVWHSQDRRQSTMEGAQASANAPYWFRLEGRLTEMQERRRRLIKYLYKKEGRLHEFEEGYKQSIAKKSTIIKKFTSMQLEDLLRTSTKNVAQEVVSSLIPSTGGVGVLADIERIYNQQSTFKKPVTGPGRRGDEEMLAQDSVDASTRGSAARQSRSANAAARSLTRRNQ